MLKRSEYVFESTEFKIINPTSEMREDINNEVVKIMNKNQSANPDEVYGNPKLNKYLLEKLVVSDNIDYQFSKYSLSKFKTLLESDIDELEEIMFHVGNILSRVIITKLRENLLNLKISEMRILQAEAINELNNLNETMVEIEQAKNKKEDKKRIDKLLKDKGIEVVK